MQPTFLKPIPSLIGNISGVLKMSRYLVTNTQYQAFLQAADGYADKRWWRSLQKPDSIQFIQGQSSNRPATLIAWSEALAFCRWLSFKTGLDISLPTEQQWEQAARGTDGRIYPWGNRYQLGYTNCSEVTRPDESLLESSVVGIYPQGASPDGLLDMSGNVAEWCLGELNDAWHIYRGGAFDSASEDVSCLERESDEDLYIENQGLESVGFRLCCTAS
jgi:formylglycine-generating enzyme required for sulfatase activity